ncbi:MAG: hypothetical protein ACREQK_10625 [Candidatus Binatia bacterium]
MSCWSVAGQKNCENTTAAEAEAASSGSTAKSLQPLVFSPIINLRVV